MIGSDGGSRRRRAWTRVLSALAVLGVMASAALGYWWTASHDQADRRAVEQVASGVTASMTASLQRDLDFQDLMSQRVATDPDMTNGELSSWAAGLDLAKRYPSTIGLGFLERVTAADLPGFEAILKADPEADAPGGLGPIFPSGARPSYCLFRLGVRLVPIPMPVGVDMCAPSWPGIGSNSMSGVLTDVAGTGRTVVLSYPSLVSAYQSTSRPVPAWVTKTFEGLFLAVTPVYSGGGVPATPELRRSLFRGWLLGTFSTNALISAALGRQSGVAVTAYALAGGRPVLLGSGGAVRGSHATLTSTLGTEPPFLLEVRVPEGSDPLVTGILLGLLGAMVSGLPLGVGMHLARSREGALRLVEERTRDLRHQAEHDTLTGLANRTLLQDLADRMLDNAERFGGTVTATFVDLDDFKEVNDSLGHRIGDSLLRSVGDRLLQAVGPRCVVGRLGGDEFLVLTASDDVGAPETTAERVLSALTEPVLVADGPDGDRRIPVNASIGVASSAGGTSDELIRDADIALYDAKGAGKGGFSVFRPSMQAAIQERLGIAADLRHSIGNGELYVVYQPIVDLGSGEVQAAEALVRWDHPGRGLVPPGQFIPIAEQTGLINEIGDFVLGEACRQAAVWARAGTSIGVAVNASALQMLEDSFGSRVGRILAANDLDPRLLTIEITESVLMQDTNSAYRTIAELHDMGVRLAIDDFGTGYSSLAYLQRFPIDALKIDRSFVLSAGQTDESRSLIDAFVQIGQALGLEVIAEGIEEPAQLHLLAERGCLWGQGYLLSRPLSESQMAALLATGSSLIGRNPAADPSG